MKARLYLMKADYVHAVQSANEVTVESNFVFNEASSINPLYEAFSVAEFHGGLSYWKDGAETGDLRIDTYFGTQPSIGYGADTLYQVIMYSNPDDIVKIYTLNEMVLIKAEAFARGGVGDALAEINLVRNNTGLTNYSGSEILKQIYIQRSYELYLTGNHYEDLRRFKDDGIDLVEKHRSRQLAHEWIIYPSGEADSNPNIMREY